MLVIGLNWAPLAEAQQATQPAANVEADRQDRSAQLEHRDRLWSETNRLYEQRQFEAALQHAELLRAAQRELFSEPTLTDADIAALTARIQAGLKHWDAAVPLARGALEIRQRSDAAGWQTADARVLVAHIETLQTLTDEQHAQLQEAERADGQISALFGKQQVAAAVELARRQVGVYLELLGETSFEYAMRLRVLAYLHQGSGNLAEAEPLYRQSLESFQAAVGERHPQYAQTLHNLAETLGLAGQYARAEQTMQQVIDIRRHAYGKNYPSYPNDVFARGLYCWKMRDFAEAESHLREATQIWKETLGEAHDDHLFGLNSLIQLYRNSGALDRAIEPARQLLEIRRKAAGEQHPMFATSLNSLALLHIELGQYDEAEPLIRQAMRIHEAASGKQDAGYINALNNLALLLHHRGEFARALPLYREALELRKAVVGEDDPAYGQSLNNLAGVYDSLGDLAAAEPLFRQAHEIYRKAFGQADARYAMSLNNLAFVYANMGDYARAEPLYVEAVNIHKQLLGENHPDYATVLNNLGGLYGSTGNYARAISLLEQALAIRRRALGERNLHYAKSLNNMAELYLLAGQFEKAQAYYRRATELFRELLGEQSAFYALGIANLSQVFARQGNIAQAEELCKRSMHIYEQLGESPELAFVLNMLGHLYHSTGDYEEAAAYYGRALSVTRDSIESASLAQSQRQQLAMGRRLRFQLDGYISLGLESGSHAQEVFSEVLSWKGATLVRQRAIREAAADPGLAELFSKLQRVAQQLATLSRAAPATAEQQQALQQRLEQLTVEKEQYEADLSRRSSAYREVTQRASVEELLAALPQHTVLIDFLEFARAVPVQEHDSVEQRELVAFIVRHADDPADCVTMIGLGPMGPLNETIEIWRASYGASASGKAAGATLRGAVWEPLLEYVGNADTTVLVSMDGALGKLPLTALPGKQPGTYLIEDHRVAMVPVPQLLPSLAVDSRQAAGSAAILLIGDVDYDQMASGARQEQAGGPFHNSTAVRGDGHWFAALPNTAGEVATIHALASQLLNLTKEQVVLLEQSGATVEQFRELAPQSTFLHLATHGYFAPPQYKSAEANDAQSPGMADTGPARRDGFIAGFAPGLLSGLALAGANHQVTTDGDDGILTAEEIATLPLEGVDLVTLSACETGLGATAGGEGLLGLQRAFQVSGARTTIASYWSVNDLATRLLMERFYRNLWANGLSKLDALREAQLYYLHHPDELSRQPGDHRAARLLEDHPSPQRASPALWAAFMLSGDWQ